MTIQAKALDLFQYSAQSYAGPAYLSLEQVLDQQQAEIK